MLLSRLPVEESSELLDEVFKSEEKELNNSQIKDINSRDRQIYAGLPTEPAAGPLNRSSERALHKSTLLISGQAAALSAT